MRCCVAVCRGGVGGGGAVTWFTSGFVFDSCCCSYRYSRPAARAWVRSARTSTTTTKFCESDGVVGMRRKVGLEEDAWRRTFTLLYATIDSEVNIYHMTKCVLATVTCPLDVLHQRSVECECYSSSKSIICPSCRSLCCRAATSTSCKACKTATHAQA
jgi:hypothetical protein